MWTQALMVFKRWLHTIDNSENLEWLHIGEKVPIHHYNKCWQRTILQTTDMLKHSLELQSLAVTPISPPPLDVTCGS